MTRLRLLLLLTVAAVTAACTAPASRFDVTEDPAFLSPRADRSALTVTRARSVIDDGCSYLVTLDSSVAGKLAPLGWITMFPPAGTYLVSVRPEGAACPPAVQTRTRLEANGPQRLELTRSADGNLGWGGTSRSP